MSEDDFAVLAAEQAAFTVSQASPSAKLATIDYKRDVVGAVPLPAPAPATVPAKPKKMSLFATRMKLSEAPAATPPVAAAAVISDTVMERESTPLGVRATRFPTSATSFPVAESVAEWSESAPTAAKPLRKVADVGEWMRDVTASASETQSSLLRFDFDGRVIEASAAVPASGGGLFHHGQQESRPGYSIAELLHLCKSTVFAQRLLATTVVLRLVKRFDEFSAAQRKLIVESFSLRGLELLQIVRHALDADSQTQLCAIGVELLRALLSCGTLAIGDARRLAAATGVEPLPAAFAANQQRLLDGLSMRLCIRHLVEMQLIVRLRFLRTVGGLDVGACFALLAYQCPHTAALLTADDYTAPAAGGELPAVFDVDELLLSGEQLYVESLSDGDVDAIAHLHRLARSAARWAEASAVQRRVQAVARRLLDVVAPHIARAANATAPPWTSFAVLAATHRHLRAAAFAGGGGVGLPHDVVLRVCCVGIRCGDAAALATRLFAAVAGALELSDGAAATVAALYADSDALRDGLRDWPVGGGLLARAYEADEALLVAVLRVAALLIESGVSADAVECGAHVLALFGSHSAAFASDVVQAAARPIVARAVASGGVSADAAQAVLDEFCATGVAARFWLNTLFLPMGLERGIAIAQRMLAN